MYLNAPSGAAPRRPLIMKLGLRCGCCCVEEYNTPFVFLRFRLVGLLIVICRFVAFLASLLLGLCRFFACGWVGGLDWVT
jgi:hypothetical protein